MDITGAWRRVEDEEVEFAPVGIGNELLEGTGSHTTSPESGSGGRNEETNGKQFDTILIDGNDEVAPVFLDSVWTLVFHVEHLWHRGTEDIRIKQSHLVTETCQGNGEVGRDCALAYTTFT